MPSIPPNLPSPLAPVAATINHLLAQEPWARDALRPHAGKVACINASPAVLRLQATSDGYVDVAAGATAASVTIRVKLSDLPLIAQNRDRAFSYVQLEGDADFANTISQLVKSLRWEAEHDLEKLFGPVVAVRMVEGAKSLFSAFLQGNRKLAENTAEYLLEENPVLVRPEVTDDFGADVTRLRDDVERFAKRLANLEKKFGLTNNGRPT
jgi:ubiquinone biosynthesis accessory factor UbiJ